MRVGLDHLPGVTHAPGVGRYSRELARALGPLPRSMELVLSEVGPGERTQVHRLVEHRSVPRIERRVSERRIRLGARWLRRGVERFLPPLDLFHRTRPLLPSLGPRVPFILPIADLPAEGSRAEATLGAEARAARAVLVFARGLAPVVAARFDLDPARVHFTPVGCEHFERDLRVDPEPATRPRLLVLGGVRRERRPRQLLEAFAHLRAGGVDAELVWIGRAGDGLEELRSWERSSPAAQHLRWVSDPVEEDLPGWIASADALVHLAERESSPVTPLEAFCAGTAVCASRLPAFEEALGELATWAPANGTPDELAATLDLTLQGASVPESAMARREQARPWTWEACARATLAAWEKVLGPAS